MMAVFKNVSKVVFIKFLKLIHRCHFVSQMLKLHMLYKNTAKFRLNFMWLWWLFNQNIIISFIPLILPTWPLHSTSFQIRCHLGFICVLSPLNVGLCIFRTGRLESDNKGLIPKEYWFSLSLRSLIICNFLEMGYYVISSIHAGMSTGVVIVQGLVFSLIRSFLCCWDCMSAPFLL